MADWVFGLSRQLSLNKFFDPSTPSMRKVDDRETKKKKEKKRMSFIVAARSCQKKQFVGFAGRVEYGWNDFLKHTVCK